MPNKYREITSLPVKMACTLSKWELLSYEQFCSTANVNYLISKLNLTEYDTYFRAIFMRNTGKQLSFFSVWGGGVNLLNIIA